jgi:hypothetical protein
MKRLFATAVFAVALALLLLATGRAAVADDVKIKGAVVEGIVVPDNIYDRQPFSFAVPQSAGGNVSVQTASGEVVQSGKSDKYGRVFLPAGLPAGGYLISSGRGDGRKFQSAGKIDIQQRPSDALERPGENPPQPMHLRDAPQAVKLNDSLSLKGHGFNPNCAEMQAGLSASGQIHTVPVLAATEDQLKLAPVAQLSPGITNLTVTNTATGQSTEPRQLLIYDMQGHLERRKLKSGSDQTQLVVNTRPENFPLKVQASVVSGPVDFGGGVREADVIANHGQAIFFVHAERGAGPFQLAWTLANPELADDAPSNPKEWLEEKAKDCQKGADTSDNSQNQTDLKNEAKQDQATADDPKNWDKDGQPPDKKKFGKFLNDEIERLKKILKKEGDGNGKDSIKKAMSDAIEAGKAAGLKF